MIVFIVVLSLFLVYALSTMCRRGHKGLPALRGWAYAHRGLHEPGVPENSMAAFRAALEHGYGIELDIHRMADGNLAVIHDTSLLRTAGVDVKIEDLTADDLSRYHLEDTEEVVPLFSQVLSLYDGKAPLIVELKSVGDNYAALCEAACDLLADYNGAYCIESFDPRCVAWLRKHRPQVIRGQLAENFCRSGGKLPPVLKFILTHQIENFLCLPDFVSYKFADRKCFSNFLARRLWGAQGVTWTIRSKQDFDAAVAEGWLPIFENFQP